MKLKINITLAILLLIIFAFISTYLIWFAFAISKNIKGMIFTNAVLLILSFIIGIYYENWLKHEW